MTTSNKVDFVVNIVLDVIKAIVAVIAVIFCIIRLVQGDLFAALYWFVISETFSVSILLNMIGHRTQMLEAKIAELSDNIDLNR